MLDIVKTRKTRLAAVLATGAISAGAVAVPAASAQPVVTGGLVNVTVTNLLNNNQVGVQIPITAAANVCGVDVVALASQVANGGATCTSRSGNQSLSISPLP
jgi:hypothetical protein